MNSSNQTRICRHIAHLTMRELRCTFVFTLFILLIYTSNAFFKNTLSKFSSQQMLKNLNNVNKENKEIENKLLEILYNVDGRGAKSSPDVLNGIETKILMLESMKSVQNPTDSPLLDGTWKLLYTSSPG